MPFTEQVGAEIVGGALENGDGVGGAVVVAVEEDEVTDDEEGDGPEEDEGGGGEHWGCGREEKRCRMNSEYERSGW